MGDIAWLAATNVDGLERLRRVIPTGFELATPQPADFAGAEVYVAAAWEPPGFRIGFGRVLRASDAMAAFLRPWDDPEDRHWIVDLNGREHVYSEAHLWAVRPVTTWWVWQTATSDRPAQLRVDFGHMGVVIPVHDGLEEAVWRAEKRLRHWSTAC